METVKDLLRSINTREQSLLLWIIILTMWILTKKDARESILNGVANVLKALFKFPVILIFLSYTAYILGFVYLAWYFKVWDLYLLKDFLVWLLFTGFMFLLNTESFSRGNFPFKQFIVQNGLLLLLIEFIISFKTFSLAIELLLVPLLFLLVGVNAYSGNDVKYRPVLKLTNILLALTGISLLYFTAREIIIDSKTFLTTQTLKEFLQPIFLSTLSIPFFYSLAVYFAYERLFSRTKFICQNDKLYREFKKLTFKKCRFSLARLTKFVGAKNKHIIQLRDTQSLKDIF